MKLSKIYENNITVKANIGNTGIQGKSDQMESVQTKTEHILHFSGDTNNEFRST